MSLLKVVLDTIVWRFCLMSEKQTTKDNNEVQRLAFRYDDNTKVWEGFEYEITEKYRKFLPSDEPVVKLERIVSNNDEITR